MPVLFSTDITHLGSTSVLAPPEKRKEFTGSFGWALEKPRRGLLS